MVFTIINMDPEGKKFESGKLHPAGEIVVLRDKKFTFCCLNRDDLWIIVGIIFGVALVVTAILYKTVVNSFESSRV